MERRGKDGLLVVAQVPRRHYDGEVSPCTLPKEDDPSPRQEEQLRDSLVNSPRGTERCQYDILQQAIHPAVQTEQYTALVLLQLAYWIRVQLNVDTSKR